MALLLHLLPLLSGLTLFAAQDIPANDGWVTDQAGVLNRQQEASLEALMESYQTGSGQDVAVLIVADLGGRALEPFALEVARTWKLGNAETNEGALLLIAVAERKVRIEVGRGLEGNVPDIVAGRIISDVIRPHFKAGNYYTGIDQGVRAIHAAAGGDYGPIQRTRGGRSRSGSALGLFPLILFFLILGGLGRGGRHGGGRSGGWFWPLLMLSSMGGRGHYGGGGGGFGGGGGGGFGGFGGGGGFSGGGASGGW